MGIRGWIRWVYSQCVTSVSVNAVGARPTPHVQLTCSHSCGIVLPRKAHTHGYSDHRSQGLFDFRVDCPTSATDCPQVMLTALDMHRNYHPTSLHRLHLGWVVLNSIRFALSEHPSGFQLKVLWWLQREYNWATLQMIYWTSCIRQRNRLVRTAAI